MNNVVDMSQKAGRADRAVAKHTATRLWWAALVTGCVGCGGGESTPSMPSATLILNASVAYIGTTNVCATPGAVDCLRGPASPGNFVHVSQAGNSSKYQVASDDPIVASGIVVMLGAGGQGDPAIELVGHKAGTTRLTVTGANGATASLPITVTTVSALALKLNDLPTVTNLAFFVHAPTGAPCPGFEGGYTFYWGPLTTPYVALENFPAMGTGNLDQCVFSTVEVIGSNTAGTTLVDKVFHLAISLGHDNPIELALP